MTADAGTPRRTDRGLPTFQLQQLPPLPDLPFFQRMYADPRLRESIPLRVGLWMARLRAELLWRRSPGGRQEALDGMRFLLQASGRASEIPEISRRFVYQNAARTEFEWRPRLGAKIPAEGLDHLLRARSAGRGVILHFIHHGPYPHFITVLDHHEIRVWAPMTDFYFGEPMPGLTGHRDRAHLRCASAANPFPATGSYDRIVNILSSGQIVALASDLPGSLSTTFLGRKIAVSSGTTRLALAERVPVVCFTWHPPQRGLLPLLRFHPPLEVDAFDDARALQNAIFAIHEPAVRAWPEALERPCMRWTLAEDDASAGAVSSTA